MNKKLLLSSLILLIGNTWAVVPASVDRSEIGLGQSFSLTINLPNSSATPDLDILKANFEVFGTSSSSQTSIVNGKISSENTLTVNLAPKKAGKQQIPAIKVGNDTTSPISINVVSDNSQQPTNTKNNDIFLEANVSNKQSAYIGVPFNYSVKLYFKVSLNNVSMEPINVNGAQVQPQGKSSQYQAKVGGVNYNVVEQNFTITPSRAGNLTIPAVKVSGNTVNSNNDPFMMMGGGKPFVVSTKPLNITINDIPKDIAPNEWLPAKKLTVTDNWSINSSQINIGDPITHTISLEALGVPASVIPELTFVSPDGVNAYPDKSQSNTVQSGSDLVGNKTFKIAYIATKSGEITFPEIKIKWWDISSNSLKTALVASKTYTITANSASTLPNNPATNTIAKDSNSNLSNASESKIEVSNTSLVNNWWKYLTFIFATLWGITLLIAIRFYILAKRHRDIVDTAYINTNEVTANQSIDNPSLQRACQEENLSALNNALINWGRRYTTRKVYSICDIKSIVSNDDFSNLIDEISSAIYSDKIFTRFNQVEEIIASVEKQLQTKASKKSLAEFYPC